MHESRWPGLLFKTVSDPILRVVLQEMTPFPSRLLEKRRLFALYFEELNLIWCCFSPGKMEK